MRLVTLLLMSLPAWAGPPGFREIFEPFSPAFPTALVQPKKKAFDAAVARLGLAPAIKHFVRFEAAVDALQAHVDKMYAVYVKAGLRYWGWRQANPGAEAEQVPQNINRAYIDREIACKKALALLWRERSFHAWVETRTADLIDGDAKVVAALLSGIRSRNPYQRLRCTRLLAKVLDPKVSAALLKRARSEREPAVAGALFEAHAGGEGLDHAAWQARAGAIRGLKRRRSRTSVEMLVARMQEEQGRLLDDCADALRHLTGQALGGNAAAWKRWWESAGDGWEPPPAGPAPEANPARPPAVGSDGKLECLGIPTRSLRVVFCFDSATFVGQEFRKAIAALPDQAEFGIVLSNGAPKAWRKKLVPAHSGNKKAAAAYLAGVKADARSDVRGALHIALDMGADTVYFFTGRGPSSGSSFTTQLMFTDPPQVALEIVAHNMLRGVRIHAMGPSDGGNAFWLQRIAKQFGGVFRGR